MAVRAVAIVQSESRDRVRISQNIRTIAIILRNAIMGGNLAALSLLRNPRHAVAYMGESLFLYKAISSRRGIPQRNVFEVLPCEDVHAINLGRMRGNEGFFGPLASYTADLISLGLICQIIRPKMVFEVGTLTGYTAYHFALNTEPDAKIYTLDLPKDGRIAMKLRTTTMDDDHIAGHLRTRTYTFDGTDVASKITCLFGDSAAYDFSPFQGKVDLFFIDGAHSYEYVRSDTLKAFTCCHPGSVIAWHDFGRVGVNGVSKWLVELAKKQMVFSIPGGSLAFMVVR